MLMDINLSTAVLVRAVYIMLYFVMLYTNTQVELDCFTKYPGATTHIGVRLKPKLVFLIIIPNANFKPVSIRLLFV